MEIGAYIEFELSKKEITKRGLHEMLLIAYPEDFTLAYNTFSSKVAGNTLTALELLQISSLLDIDLNYLIKLLKEKNSSLHANSSLSEKIQNDSIPVEVEELFLKFSPNIPRKENGEPVLNSLQYKITRKQKNYELIGFLDHKKSPEQGSLMFVEEINLGENEIRVVAKYETGINDALSFDTKTIDWHKDVRRIACEKSEDYFVLFPRIIGCKERSYKSENSFMNLIFEQGSQEKDDSFAIMDFGLIDEGAI